MLKVGRRVDMACLIDSGHLDAHVYAPELPEVDGGVALHSEVC